MPESDFSALGRAPVLGRHGCVATSQVPASLVAIEVLRGGGNAVDAAIAASAILNVVEPHNSHLGGDAFALIYLAKENRVVAINGSGAAPAAATLDKFGRGVPSDGLLTATIPGEVDLWDTALTRFGTRPLSELLQPAIALAREGFPLSPRSAASLADHRDVLARYPSSAKFFLSQEPRMGVIRRQPELADTLERIAAGGRDEFYCGETALRIVRFCQANGGLFTEEDLAQHHSEVLEPIATTYRGYQLCEQPPVSQGIILLEALNIVENFDLASLDPRDPQVVHLLVEAIKLGFADKRAYAGDPRLVAYPFGKIVSKDFAAARARDISATRAMAAAASGRLSDTTYFCTADKEGNAVSYIQSVFQGFGSRVVVEGTGILLNNRMAGFDLDPASPNCLAPRKRPIHTLNTYMVLRDGRPYLVGGTPGGDKQVQTNLQVITAMIDFGLDVQEAIELPKWGHGGGVTLWVEPHMPAATGRGLRERGHDLRLFGPWGQGCAVQLIRVDRDNDVFVAGSDRRADGCALGI